MSSGNGRLFYLGLNVIAEMIFAVYVGRILLLFFLQESDLLRKVLVRININRQGYSNMAANQKPNTLVE